MDDKTTEVKNPGDSLHLIAEYIWDPRPLDDLNVCQVGPVRGDYFELQVTQDPVKPHL